MLRCLLLVLLLGTAGACRYRLAPVAPPPGLTESQNATAYPITHHGPFRRKNAYRIGEFHVFKLRTGWPHARRRSKRVRGKNTFEKLSNTLTRRRVRLQNKRVGQTFRFAVAGFSSMPAQLTATEALATERIRQSVRGVPVSSRIVAEHYLLTGQVLFPADSADNRWEFTLYSDWQDGSKSASALQTGIVTNLRDLIEIREEVRRDLIDRKTGEIRPLPTLLGSRPTLPGGYGFYQDDEPIGFFHEFMATRARLWLRNDLDARRKTLLSALASALLKRDHNPDAFLLGRHPVFGKLRLVP